MKQTYKISFFYTFIIFPVFLLVALAYSYYFFLCFKSIEGEEIIGFVLFAGAASIIFKFAYRIDVEDNLITFFTLLGKKKISVENIVSMREGVFAVKVRYKNGTVYISTLTEYFSELKNNIKHLSNASYKMYD